MGRLREKSYLFSSDRERKNPELQLLCKSFKESLELLSILNDLEVLGSVSLSRTMVTFFFIHP